MKNTAQLEQTLRKFTLDKLEALATLLDENETIYSKTTISGVLDLQAHRLGARLSSFTRTRINDEPLFIAVGKTADEGIIWKLNEKVAPKKDIKRIVAEILE